MVPILDGPQTVCLQTRRPHALHRGHSAPQRDRRAAHGAHAERNHSRHTGAPCPHGGQERLLGARHRPRLHRHGGQGGEPLGRAGREEERPDARRIPQARLELDRGARRHHSAAVAPRRCLVRLGPHGFHHGRGAFEERHPRLCRPLPQRTHLPRRAHGQLGPQGADRTLRRGSSI